MVQRRSPKTLSTAFCCMCAGPAPVAGLLAGSALAAAGVLLQAVLNNAMASPNVIGVNAGAGLAALCAAALWPAHPNAVQPAAFAGALAAALLVYGLALGAGVSRTTLVLAGLAVSGMLTAGMNTIKLLYPDAIAGASDFFGGRFVRRNTVRAERRCALPDHRGRCWLCCWRQT